MVIRRNSLKLVASVVTLLILIVCAGCTIDTSSPTENLASQILTNSWGGHNQTEGTSMLEATGNGDYVGSSTFPGTIEVKDDKNGAHIITFTVEAKSGGTLWDSGKVQFVYWLSEDGKNLRRENINSQMLQ